MSNRIELYTFAISHFSEKVRWALDFEGIEYEERRLLPGLHPFTTRRLAPKNSVPLLRDGDWVVQGSGEILRALPEHFDAHRLEPAPALRGACDELEALADHAFGRGVQTIAYGVLLEQRAQMIDLWSISGPRWASAFYSVTYPLLSVLSRRLYRPTPERVKRAKERFRAALVRTDGLLQSTPYLLGASLTRADLTVAALLAPFLGPPEHPVPFPALPAELRSFTEEFRNGPTASHVLRLYREHRAPESLRRQRLITV